MPKVYIAGPMTGLPNLNRDAFHEAAAILLEQGLEVVSPAEFEQEGDWEQLMKRAIAEMLSCDFVTLLDGWERSRGARLEVFIAREVGMEIETLVETIWNSTSTTAESAKVG